MYCITIQIGVCTILLAYVTAVLEGYGVKIIEFEYNAPIENAYK